MGRGPLADDGGAGRVLIPRRFNGPPASANGGYASGLVARYIRGGGAAEVSLRSPPPLDTALAIKRTEDGRVQLCHRELLVAEGGPAEPPDVEPPVRPTVAEAREALRRHPWRGARHPFSDCYVCGIGRVRRPRAALRRPPARADHDRRAAGGRRHDPARRPRHPARDRLGRARLPELRARAVGQRPAEPARLDAGRAARADPARRADRGLRLAARVRGPQAAHRVGAAERRRAHPRPRAVPVGAAAGVAG